MQQLINSGKSHLLPFVANPGTGVYSVNKVFYQARMLPTSKVPSNVTKKKVAEEREPSTKKNVTLFREDVAKRLTGNGTNAIKVSKSRLEQLVDEGTGEEEGSASDTKEKKRKKKKKKRSRTIESYEAPQPSKKKKSKKRRKYKEEAKNESSDDSYAFNVLG